MLHKYKIGEQGFLKKPFDDIQPGLEGFQGKRLTVLAHLHTPKPHKKGGMKCDRDCTCPIYEVTFIDGLFTLQAAECIIVRAKPSNYWVSLLTSKEVHDKVTA